MSLKTDTVKTMPDFKHCLEPDIDSSLGLADTISMMTSRAAGILNLLIINQENGGMVADHIAVSAIYAAIAELKDIDAAVIAFHQAKVDAENKNAGGAQ